VDGDIDFANKSAHMVGGLPGLPGYSGELIVVDPYTYSRPYGATKYTTDGDSTLAINPVLSSGPESIVAEMLTVANDPGMSPVLVGTEQEQYGTCYHIRLDVTESALDTQLQSTAVVQALSGGKLDLWITQGDFQLERLEFSTSDPTAGNAAVRLVLSNWNNVALISAPPMSEIDTGPTPSS